MSYPKDSYDEETPPLINYSDNSQTHQLQPSTPIVDENPTRYIWSEVELAIFSKLRRGLHPEHIELHISQGFEQADAQNNQPRIEFYSLSKQIWYRLEAGALFKHMPPFAHYKEVSADPVKKAAFEIMMYNRFGDEEMLRRIYMDTYIRNELADAKPLDEREIKQLRYSQEVVNKETERNYRENLMIFRKHKNLDHGRKKGQPSTTFVQGFEIDPFGPRQQSFSWEGPGSLPGCYSKPPVCPRLSLPPVVAAPMTPLIEATDKLSELRMGPEDQRCSEDAMDTSNLNGGGFGALQPPITCTWADLPVTPKNKKTWPEFGEEIPCQAFKSRPILHFGSPGKIKRPRPASNSP